jgi:hypothetical protein
MRDSVARGAGEKAHKGARRRWRHDRRDKHRAVARRGAEKEKGVPSSPAMALVAEPMVRRRASRWREHGGRTGGTVA